MAVISVKYGQVPGNATFARTGDNLVIPYVVRCDDPADGPYTVLARAGLGPLPGPGQVGLPTVGNTYAWGNDTGPARLVDLQITNVVVKETDSGAFDYIEYKVNGNFIKEVPDGLDPNGNPTADPLNVQAQVIPGWRTITEVIENAEFLGYFDAAGIELTPNPNADTGAPKNRPVGTSLTKGDKYVPQNSATTPYVPAIERERAIETVTTKAYYRPWSNAWNGIIGKINDAAYTISQTDGSGTVVYNRTFPIYTLYLHSISPEFRQIGNQIWYWVTVEFWYEPRTWYADVHDSGKQIVGKEGSDSWKTEQKPIQSERGQISNEPQKLDGTGRLLNDSTAVINTTTDVYLRWRDIEPADFSQLNLRF